MQITSFIAFYPCSDIKKTGDFYRLIGLREIVLGETVRLYDSGRGYLGFVQSDSGAKPDGQCLSLNCRSNSDVDAVYRTLKDKIATIVAPPADHPKFPVYSFFLKDPDGYLVEFQKIKGLAI